MIRSSSGLSDRHCPSDPDGPSCQDYHTCASRSWRFAVLLGHLRNTVIPSNTCTSAQTPEQPITARGCVCMADRHLFAVCLSASAFLPSICILTLKAALFSLGLQLYHYHHHHHHHHHYYLLHLLLSTSSFLLFNFYIYPLPHLVYILSYRTHRLSLTLIFHLFFSSSSSSRLLFRSSSNHDTIFSTLFRLLPTISLFSRGQTRFFRRRRDECVG